MIYNAIMSLEEPLNSVDSKLVMGKLYDFNYGIHNHLASEKTRPLAAIGYNKAEDIGIDTGLEKSIDIFLSSKIKDLYGLTLSDFLSLPTHVSQILIDKAAKELKNKSLALEKIKEDIEK